MARSEVGTCTNGMPRMYVEATNPARSPTTPPPRATTAQSRVSPSDAMADQISPATASDFESSPAGTTISLTRKPAAFSDDLASSRYSGPTLESVRTSRCGASPTPSSRRTDSPRPASTVAPMRTS